MLIHSNGRIKGLLEGSGGRVRFTPIVDRQGTAAWPGKFLLTDVVAREANLAIGDPSKRLISLESKRRELNAGGRRVYELEMLLDRVAAGSPSFDRATIDRLL